VCRALQLKKLPSGRGIIDMKNKYIVEKYREALGQVRYQMYLILLLFLNDIENLPSIIGQQRRRR
jgi:hypothetical protein